MSRMKRIATLAGTGVAVCAALLSAQTASAQAAPLPAASPVVAHAPAANPDGINPTCGWVWNGFTGQAWYNNCSNFSVEIRIEWWFSSDTYACVGPHFTDVLNAYDTTAPEYAVFDGRTNC